MLRIGDLAPDFELKDQFGNLVTLEQMAADGNLILYFYPADFSPILSSCWKRRSAPVICPCRLNPG